MTLPYIPIILIQIVEEAGSDGLEVFVNFLHNKYGELPDLDIITLIVHFFIETLEHLRVRGLLIFPL